MIGILTFHRAANYGAVLQAYALQQVLNEYQIENEIIDYRCSHVEKQYECKPHVSPIHIRQFAKEIIEIPTRKEVRRQFDEFIGNYLKTSKSVYKKDFSEIHKNYKALITGSDQVWNLAVSGNDTTYMLDFAGESVKKISYAASIGPKEIEVDNKKTLSKYLKRYDYISVREPAAKYLVEAMTGKAAVLDADPTILLSIEKWDKLVQKSKLNYKNYIFVYIMQPSQELYDLALKLAEQEKLQIYSLSMVPNKRKLGRDIRGIGVQDFLWMIKNANYVVTNSFHGLLFSIRFHKRFYWAFQKGTHMSNPRFEMLSEQYGIECRRCQELGKISNCTEINFDEIEKLMDNQRETSIGNLLNSVEDAD